VTVYAVTPFTPTFILLCRALILYCLILALLDPPLCGLCDSPFCHKHPGKNSMDPFLPDPLLIGVKRKMIKIEQFHHITNEVSNVETTRDFYVKIFGFEEVKRPNLRCHGAWLDGLGLHLHLIEAFDLPAFEKRKAGRLFEFENNVPFVDHIAFLADDLAKIERILIEAKVCISLSLLHLTVLCLRSKFKTSLGPVQKN
jgi:hypothetical protein